MLGVKVFCYSFLDCIVIGKSSPTQKFFKVSEEKEVTGSQVWTVGWMVKYTKSHFFIAARDVRDLCAGALS